MSDLTGVWFADDMAFYYFYDDGKEVWWAGLSIDGVFDGGIRSTSVFRGLYANSNTVNGQWVQVPRGQTIDSGLLSVAIDRGVSGDAHHLVATGSPFGKAQMWRFKHSSPPDNISRIFPHVRRNGHDSMDDKVSVYREPVTVFGTVRLLEDRFPITVNWDPSYGRSYKDFICWNSNSPPDGDMNFDITVDRGKLDRQNFWDPSQWARPSHEIINKLDHHQNDLHCEIIMYGRDAKCSDLKPGRPVHRLLPGWQEQAGDSVIVNGVPINGAINFGRKENGHVYELTQVGPIALQLGQVVRVTGALCVDLGHGDDPAEIHPVYSVDLLQGSAQDDLSGVWADDYGRTYYLRQLDTDVWCYCADSVRYRWLSGVFNGRNSGGRIVAAYRDVPLAQNTELRRLALDLQLDETKLYLLPNDPATAGLVGTAGLRKLRDALIGPPIPIG
ncbi:MAG: hypothetical protein JWM53_2511 [bacterium]|nr:hypothetical protein [bacterium]